MGVRQTFNDFQPSTRRLLVASLVVGVLLLIGFTLTDAGVDLTLRGWDPKPVWLKRYNADWFHSHAYIPNIYAGITGFLIGAPVAAVVLGTFEIQRQEHADLEKANRVSLRAWTQFCQAVRELCSDERLDGLLKAVADNNNQDDSVLTRHREVAKRLNDYASGQRTQQDYDELVAYLSEAVPALDDAFRDLNRKVGVAGSRDGQRAWAKVVSHWRYIDSSVRTERYGLNLAWFDDDANSDLTSMISDTTNPFADFSRLHGGADPFDRSVTVAEAVKFTKAIAVQKSKERLESFLAVRGYFVKDDPHSDYVDAALNAHTFFFNLRQAVEFVDALGWPASASKPQKNIS